jgi:hypothetical protein
MENSKVDMVKMNGYSRIIFTFKKNIKAGCLLIVMMVLIFSCTEVDKSTKTNTSIRTQDKIADYTLWEIKEGKFYFDGEWEFLKIGKPLRNFANKEEVFRLINDLDILKDKNYNTIEINCYWHHFDKDGDGTPDESLEPLSSLIDSIYAKGMYPCLSIETYAVGGGNIPAGFWEKFPDAYAIDDKGQKVNDTEYGFNNEVISIFHEEYRQNVHEFIKNIAQGIDTEKILYFETTVEPQYMGTINLDYSANARREYEKWRQTNSITDSLSAMPGSFPVSEDFIKNETWNKFRAQFLAQWVNDDAAAYRSVAGQNAYVAVDFLDAEESTTIRRNGDPVEFLSSLTAANIIQVNWHWYFPENFPNQKAYERVGEVMHEYDRDWAVSEHMTFNGSDYVRYSDDELQEILLNTLMQGTRFGWEFVSVTNSENSFSLYNEDWTPKREIGIVDDNWNDWLDQIRKIEGTK